MSATRLYPNCCKIITVLMENRSNITTQLRALNMRLYTDAVISDFIASRIQSVADLSHNHNNTKEQPQTEITLGQSSTLKKPSENRATMFMHNTAS